MWIHICVCIMYVYACMYVLVGNYAFHTYAFWHTRQCPRRSSCFCSCLKSIPLKMEIILLNYRRKKSMFWGYTLIFWTSHWNRQPNGLFCFLLSVNRNVMSRWCLPMTRAAKHSQVSPGCAARYLRCSGEVRYRMLISMTSTSFHVRVWQQQFRH